MKAKRDFEQCAQLMKALADPIRLQLLQCLSKGECGVSELCEAVGEDIALISHHLKILRFARIVETERRGREIIYSLNPELSEGSKPGKPCLDFGCCEFDMS